MQNFLFQEAPNKTHFVTERAVLNSSPSKRSISGMPTCLHTNEEFSEQPRIGCEMNRVRTFRAYLY